jgi:hypothetical protein
MMKVFGKFKLLAISLLALPLMAASLNAASAQSAKESVCEGIGLVTGSGDCLEDPNSPNVDSLIETIVKTLSYIAGVAGIIMIVIGGFKYITSGGDSGKIASAKTTIIYALIGLLIASLSQVLVRFVFNRTIAPPSNNTPESCAPQPGVPC